MEMSPWMTDVRCMFKKSVTVMKMLRTSRGPASSVCREFCVARARRIVFQAQRAAKTCERGPNGPGCCCSEKRKRQKPDMCGVCHESQLLVYMLWWSMVSSDVTGSPWLAPSRFFTEFLDTVLFRALAKLSGKLCRLVFFCSAHCLARRSRRHDHLQAAWI